MPTLRGDLEFLKNEGKKALGFSRDYVINNINDNRKARVIKAIEFGPDNWLRVVGAIIIALFFLITFSMWRSEGAIWMVLIILLLAYGFFFRGDDKRKGGITGFLFDSVSGVISGLIAVVVGFFTAVFGFIQETLLGAADVGGGILGFVIDLIKGIWADIVAFGTDIVMLGVGLITDLFGIVRSILTDLGSTLLTIGQEIVVDIMTSLRAIAIDLTTGIFTALREIVVEIVAAITGAISDIGSSFIAMVTDMLTFDKKGS